MKLQLALKILDDAKIAFDGAFGPGTSAAVLAYKQKRKIVNQSYQTRPDDIAGKMTVAAMDQELLQAVIGGQTNPSFDFVKSLFADGPTPPGPLPQPGSSMTIDMEGKVEVHSGTYVNKVVDPFSAPLPTKILWKDIDFSYKWCLLKVQKGGAFEQGGSLFWVIAIVPDGTTAFDRGYVFFHPTPTQIFQGKPIIHANDDNYEVLGGDWRGLADRYRELVGPQLSAAKRFPLLLPLMRNSAANTPSKLNDVFFDQPMQTILGLLGKAREKIGDLSQSSLPTQIVGGLGSASFRSGIAYHSNFLKRLPGQIVEAVDFDSTFIRIAHPDISSVGGLPIIKRHTQKSRVRPPPRSRFSGGAMGHERSECANSSQKEEEQTSNGEGSTSSDHR